MVEEIKKKTPQKQDEPESQSAEYSPQILEQLKQNGIDPSNVTLQQLFPPAIDADGNDLSLMSCAEMETMITYFKTRKYLSDKYPMSQEEEKMQGQPCSEVPNEPVEINIAKAREDPASRVFVEALLQLMPIYDKVEVLQRKASEYEKFCIRLYWCLTYNWNYIQNAKEFRGVLLDSDIFEIVEAYFKICRKYRVPTFEEPYYFLSETRRREVKLEGDMLKRSTEYSDNEIRVSIWRISCERSGQKTAGFPKARSQRLFPLRNRESPKRRIPNLREKHLLRCRNPRHLATSPHPTVRPR